nr:PH domain-containing protein [Fodinibius sp.]NIV12804.1 PH domain-containing protein [Fodinibius sp.]NIY27467.1 PH domain-containing protein [Fodinibius sp.]
MEIKPHPKLIIKQVFMLLTISAVIIIIALVLQKLIPLDKDVNPEQSAAILTLITILSLLVLWLIISPIVILWIKNLDYFIEDDRITIHKGILTKMQQNIPYRAITDFMLHRSLYDRFLGIGSIRIQTAGQTQSATGYEGKLAGLIQWDGLLQELRS